jgi:uncharacterized protein YgfB (UPF0149 family)
MVLCCSDYTVGNFARLLELLVNDVRSAVSLKGFKFELFIPSNSRQVEQSKSQIVGMMSGFFLVFGIAAGIAFTFVEPHIVNLLGWLYHLF